MSVPSPTVAPVVPPSASLSPTGADAAGVIADDAGINEIEVSEYIVKIVRNKIRHYEVSSGLGNASSAREYH